MEMIMSNFKVGDEVEFLETYSSFKIGERAEVISLDTDGTVRVSTLDSKIKIKSCWVYTRRLKLVPKDPVLTPEEVFEHLREGTKLQWRCKSTLNWRDHSGELNRIQLNELIDYDWRVKPEPEVIELNGKRYKLIEE